MPVAPSHAQAMWKTLPTGNEGAGNWWEKFIEAKLTSAWQGAKTSVPDLYSRPDETVLSVGEDGQARHMLAGALGSGLWGGLRAQRRNVVWGGRCSADLGGQSSLSHILTVTTTDSWICVLKTLPFAERQKLRHLVLPDTA